MNLTVKVTTIWFGHTSLKWEAERDIKINELVSSGKTDGLLIEEEVDTDGNLVYHRNFIDRAAAQEFVDWWNSTAAALAANIVVTDI